MSKLIFHFQILIKDQIKLYFCKNFQNKIRIFYIIINFHLLYLLLFLISRHLIFNLTQNFLYNIHIIHYSFVKIIVSYS